MALRLSDLPEHLHVMYEKQLAAEAAIAPRTEWQIVVKLGTKVFRSPTSADEQYVRRMYDNYVNKHSSRHVELVKTKVGGKV
jgi:hypothetical protein